MKSNPQFGKALPEGCRIITFKLEDKHTSIRADTSGSQARANMQRSFARVLLTARTKAQMGAKLTFQQRPGETFKVVEIQPRYDAAGRLHHYQVDLEALNRATPPKH